MAVLAVLLGALVGLSAQNSELSVNPKRVANQNGMDALPAVARAGISASIGSVISEYSAEQFAGGLRMNNRGKGINVTLTSKGVEFASGRGQWTLSLNGYGRGAQLEPLSIVQPLNDGNRVSFTRNGLTEWYVNGPLGVEQGFTISKAPKRAQNQLLTLRMSRSGSLNAFLDPDQHGITLREGTNPVLHYGGLRVTDADGRELPARMTLAPDQLRILVNDDEARYPITIDPMFQAVKLTNDILCVIGEPCDTGSANDVFGVSAAISFDGNTVVIGAPGAAIGGSTVGAAYVFQKPKGGWSGCLLSSCYLYVAKLTPSDPNSLATSFGDSVGVSSDGSTVTVGAPGDGIITLGSVYVFARPASGWTSMTQTAELSAAELDGNSSRGLGSSVGISSDGSTIVATGTYGNSDFGFVNKDWIFVKPSGGWANGTEAASVFGASFALSGDGNTLAAENFQPPPATNQPGVSVFLKPSTGWANIGSSTATLTPLDGSALGASVAISNDGTVIAASGNNSQNTHPIYLYVEPSVVRCILGTCFRIRAWSNSAETAQLSASDGKLGAPVALSGNGNEVASPGSTLNTSASGVYVFLEPSSGWLSKTETAKLTASDQESGDNFGHSVALNSDGTVMVAGSPDATIGSNFEQGAAYIFTGSPAIPRASISPTSLSFGTQVAGTTSSAQTVTLTNTGDLPLNISAVSAAGPFTTTQNCVTASTIAPGASCSENVAFAPTSAGALVGSLTFTDDSGGTAGSTQSVALSGTGVKATTSTSINSVGPNPALVGQQVTITFTVTPSAGNSLTPSGTVTVSANTGESCSGAAPSGSCTITFASAANRTLTATYNGDGSFSASTSTAVGERVVDFTLSSNPTAQTISGKKATYTVTVTSVNGFAGTVSLGCSGGPVGTTCAMLPASVTLGASANATATFTLPKSVASGPYTVTFTGTSGGVTRTITAGLTVR